MEAGDMGFATFRSVLCGRVRIKSVARCEETITRYGGDGDNFHMSWAEDDVQYVNVCDGKGFSSEKAVSYNNRIFGIEGNPHDARFTDVAGYPMLGRPTQRPSDPRYYGLGILAIGGHLYQYLSTFSVPFRPEEIDVLDGGSRVHFNGVKLIYSADNGRSWRNQDGSSPVVWESWQQRTRESLVFFNEDQNAFALLSVLQMGRGYEYNRDGFVYVYAPNGSVDGTMNELVMFRAPKTRLRERMSYEFYAGMDHEQRPLWSSDISAREPVQVFQRGWVNTLLHPYAWQPSVVYNAPLGLYMMVNWGMGCGTGGMWFGKPSYLGLWVAENPWGPWIQVYEDTVWLPGGDQNARCYQPQIAPKWISADGRSFWLVWTDYQGAAEFMNVWKDYQRGGDCSKEAVESLVRVRRKCMPYYSFNAQRVDMEIA
jgi:hypothetical protein